MRYKKFTIRISQTILDALRQLEYNNKGFLIVTNEEDIGEDDIIRYDDIYGRLK